jgi:hypothetical protein
MSRGVIAADGLHPAEFEDKRTGRDLKHLTFDSPEKMPSLQRQDLLSLMWNFAFVPPRAEVSVRVTDEKGRESTTSTRSRAASACGFRPESSMR